MVCGAPAAVPEVGGGVLVGDEEEGYSGCWGVEADGGGGGGVVFCCVSGKRFEEEGAVGWIVR